MKPQLIFQTLHVSSTKDNAILSKWKPQLDKLLKNSFGDKTEEISIDIWRNRDRWVLGFLVIDMDGKIKKRLVCALLVEDLPNEEPFKRVIWNVCVQEKYRHRGYGTKLMTFAKKMFCSNSPVPGDINLILYIKLIQKDVFGLSFDRDHSLISFYRKMGFEVVNDDQNYKWTVMRFQRGSQSKR